MPCTLGGVRRQVLAGPMTNVCIAFLAKMGVDADHPAYPTLLILRGDALRALVADCVPRRPGRTSHVPEGYDDEPDEKTRATTQALGVSVSDEPDEVLADLASREGAAAMLIAEETRLRDKGVAGVIVVWGADGFTMSTNSAGDGKNVNHTTGFLTVAMPAFRQTHPSWLFPAFWMTQSDKPKPIFEHMPPWVRKIKDLKTIALPNGTADDAGSAVVAVGHTLLSSDMAFLHGIGGRLQPTKWLCSNCDKDNTTTAKLFHGAQGLVCLPTCNATPERIEATLSSSLDDDGLRARGFDPAAHRIREGDFIGKCVNVSPLTAETGNLHRVTDLKSGFLSKVVLAHIAAGSLAGMERSMRQAGANPRLSYFNGMRAQP